MTKAAIRPPQSEGLAAPRKDPGSRKPAPVMTQPRAAPPGRAIPHRDRMPNGDPDVIMLWGSED